MKIIIKIGLFVFATFILISCNDDFLERYPLDSVSSLTFWNYESDMRVYNNNLYNMATSGSADILQGHDSDHSYRMDVKSDNMVEFDNGRANIRSGKNEIPSTGGYEGWNFLRAINIGLANYDRVNVSQSVIDKYVGEARLFRGWWYAHMVQTYGDVNWIDKELNIDSEELYAPRTPREEVMDYVLADLNFACENLPDDWGDGNAPGRLNRWAALAVKSRVCLFEGTWRKYHGGTDPDTWLQEAADASQELIEDGPYTVYSTGDPAHDYNAYHRAEDISGNSEVIYWRKYQYGFGPSSTNNIMYHWREYDATKSVVEDYLCTDGLPISLSPLYQGDANFVDVFKNRDPRLRQTILHPDDQQYYNLGYNLNLTYPRVAGVSSGMTSISGYHMIKTWNADEFLVPYDGGTHPAIILRLGETMLNYAEAKAELGTITQADLDMSINKLRDRVGMPHMDLTNIPVDPRYTSDGVSPLIVEIRRERRVELLMEGFRYDDLRRWKQGKKLDIPSYGMRWDDAAKALYDPDGTASVVTTMVEGVPYINPYYGTDWANPNFESKHYLLPISLSVLSQSPLVGQNPGWE